MYQRSIVAYLDILGFRGKIEEAEGDSSKIQQIYESLTTAQSIVNTFKIGYPPRLAGMYKIQGHMFSDTIILSCQTVSEDSVFFVIQDVAILQYLLVMQKCFLRGAITIGDHYQEGNLVFGPALIKAYEMEHQLAIWPRVIIDPAILNIFSVECLDDANWAFLTRDQYGIVYVDYLKLNCKLAMGQPYEKGNLLTHIPLNMFVDYQKIIIEVISTEKAKMNLDTKTKYHALAKYYNETIDNLCEQPVESKGESKIREGVQSCKINLSAIFPELYESKSPNNH